MGNGDEESRAVAIKGFLDIFEQVERERITGTEGDRDRKTFFKENLGQFLKRFNANYKHYKTHFLKNCTNMSDIAFQCEVERYLEVCISYLKHIINHELIIKKEYKEEAGYLGLALGSFLAILEYGICNPRRLNNNYSLSRRHGAIALEANIKTIAKLMKTIGHGIRPKFITNRIKVIAKRTPGLDRENKMFLAEIAAEFS